MKTTILKATGSFRWQPSAWARPTSPWSSSPTAGRSASWPSKWLANRRPLSGAAKESHALLTTQKEDPASFGLRGRLAVRLHP